MAQTADVVIGQKRGPGRPPKAAPVLKKLKTAPSTSPTPSAATSPALPPPTVDSPRPHHANSKLPVKLIERAPLPTLSEPQDVLLPNNEYQSIAASAILPASLDRSRHKWTVDGIFQRYWVKPTMGKNGRPPPPNNPEAKWMKLEGPCRIRIEPHIFEADVYIEKKPRPQPPKQHVQPIGQSPYGQPYRPPQQPTSQQWNGRVLPSVQQPGNSTGVLPPIQNMAQPVPTAHLHPPPPLAQENKPSQDPVISMLAGRASSDPELKALMKEVAAGNATPDQLRIFQRHIDELQALHQKMKREEDGKVMQSPKPLNTTRYENPVDTKPPQCQAPPPPPPVYQQPVYTAPPRPPTNLPVIIAFTNQGASEDRFLFPEHSILEPLSPQHLLVSFMVTRKGHEAVDSTGLEPEKEYWQPITMMVEVAYGREEILAHIRRWAQPADDVRTHMEDVMKRCQRASLRHLAIRLPIKGSAAAVDSEAVSKEATPMQDPVKSRPSVKYVKKPKTISSVPQKAANAANPGISAVAEQETPVETRKDAPKTDLQSAVEEPATTESGRPRRAVRKSVRISEG